MENAKKMMMFNIDDSGAFLFGPYIKNNEEDEGAGGQCDGGNSEDETIIGSCQFCPRHGFFIVAILQLVLYIMPS